MHAMKLAITGLVLFLMTSGAWGADHPNVVIFLADDLGWADVGFHGGPIETPSIDRLAREGAELHRFYSTPVCSPTRAALMTGRDPMRLGLAYGVVMPWSNNGVHPEERFIAEAFRDAGYQTAITGKWHLGHAQESYLPRSRGFDHFYGHLHTEVGYFPPFGNQGGRDFQRNGKTIDDEGWEPFLLAAEASRWIEARDKERPFFLYVPFIAPHTPLDAPDELKEKYAKLSDDRKTPRGTQDWARWTRFVGTGPILVGNLFGEDPATLAGFADALTGGGLPAETTAAIGEWLWAKALYNCALNPLGALLGVRYGTLARSESTRRLMDEVVREVFAVMQAGGETTRWPDAARYLVHFYETLLPPTAEHESSMLQDVRAGRRTEIDALCGEIAVRGARAGVRTPVNEALTQLIRARAFGPAS